MRLIQMSNYIIKDTGRKEKIESELQELIASGEEKSGFFLSIGSSEFVFNGTWVELGEFLTKDLGKLRIVKTEGVTNFWSGRGLDKGYEGKFSYMEDFDGMSTIAEVSMKPTKMYAPEVVRKIKKLQTEYDNLPEEVEETEKGN